jgi:hypothetical protein
MRTSACGACAAWACLVVGACGGRVSNRYDGARIGTPCVPAEEDDAAFPGFVATEVSIELPAPDADPGVLVCLANHFRGRATCPYGQDEAGDALPSVDGASGGSFPSGVGPCVTPSGAPVTGGGSEGALVEPQCADRRAAKVVTWSCRCESADGRTDDGATYCSCPDGTTCQQLVTPVGPVGGTPDISGAYCIPNGTDFDPFAACAQACDPSVTTCA